MAVAPRAPILANGLDPDGLLPKRRLLLSYDGDEWWHERILLAQVSQLGWVVVTPHGDIYVEDISSWTCAVVLGPRAGIPVSHQIMPAFLVRTELVGWLAEAEDEAVALRSDTFRVSGAGVQQRVLRPLMCQVLPGSLMAEFSGLQWRTVRLLLWGSRFMMARLWWLLKVIGVSWTVAARMWQLGWQTFWRHHRARMLTTTYVLWLFVMMEAIAPEGEGSLRESAIFLALVLTTGRWKALERWHGWSALWSLETLRRIADITGCGTRRILFQIVMVFRSMLFNFRWLKPPSLLTSSTSASYCVSSTSQDGTRCGKNIFTDSAGVFHGLHAQH